MNANLQDIREKGFAVLTKELGAAGMAQFVRQFENVMVITPKNDEFY